MTKIVLKAREKISAGDTLTYDLSESDCAEVLDVMLEMYINELAVKQKILRALPNASYATLLTYLYVWESQPHIETALCTRTFQKLEMNLYLRKG